MSFVGGRAECRSFLICGYAFTDCISRFRWAVCQLESLRKCHTLNSLRRTLQDLPNGLYETYDRILSNVPEVHRVHVQRALMWLAFSRLPMTLGQVAEAVLVGREQQSMDPVDQFRDVHDLLELCSSFVCLVGVPSLSPPNSPITIPSDAGLILRLAHSSVKEYMVSDRTKIAALNMHRLTSVNAQRFMAEVCLVHLNRLDDQSLIWDENIRKHSFSYYAATNWFFLYEEMPAEEKDSVVDLLWTFIGHAFRNWLGFCKGALYINLLDAAPLAILSLISAPGIVRAVLENAAEIHVTEDAIKEACNAPHDKAVTQWYKLRKG